MWRTGLAFLVAYATESARSEFPWERKFGDDRLRQSPILVRAARAPLTRKSDGNSKCKINRFSVFRTKGLRIRSRLTTAVTSWGS